MKKMVILFFLILFSFAGNFSLAFPNNTLPGIHEQNNDYIYIKVKINGIVYVYVYLSDGVTLVNIYEEED